MAKSRIATFTLGDRLRSRLFEHEQQFKAQDWEMRGRQDRERLSSDTRLRIITRGGKRVYGGSKPSRQPKV